jgi:hypothetical protein
VRKKNNKTFISIQQTSASIKNSKERGLKHLPHTNPMIISSLPASLASVRPCYLPLFGAAV